MKKKYQGSSRVKLQTLRKDFEMLQMKEEESVTNFFRRTMEIANKMRCHGEKIEDVTVVENFLHSMTREFNYVVCSVEESKDIDDLSLDELHSSLLLHEQKMNQSYTIDEQASKASTNTHSYNLRGKGRGDRRHRDGHRNRDDNTNFRGNNDQFQGKGRGRDFEKSRVECYRCHCRSKASW